MNFYALRKTFRQIQRASKTPKVIATTVKGKVEIDTADLLDYFFDAIKLGDIPKDHELFKVFQEAQEDPEQGQIFECLRKLAQGIEPQPGGDDLFLPRGKQAKSILESTRRLNIWYGSVRSSKTIMTLIRWLEYCLHGPKGRLMMIGNTLETLELNCLEPLGDLLPAALKYTPGWKHCFIFGRKVRLRGADDIGQEKKFKGPTLAGAYCDEVTTWAKPVWKMLLTRLSKAGSELFGTTNPDQPLHWLNKDYIEKAKDLSLTLWHFVLDDNPGLTEEYKADLVRENPPGTVYYLRFILGLWVAAEGRVFSFFSADPKDDYVVLDEPQDLVTWIISIDYGQEHPTVMGLWGYSLSKKCWYLVKEWYTSNKPNTVYSQEFGREMLKYKDKDINPLYVVCDPGGGGLSLIEQLKAEYPRITIQAAKKEDVLKEIQAFGSAIYQKLVRFCARCKRFIAETAGYLWNEKVREKGGKEEPLKLNNDGPDMGRYFWNKACKL